MEVLINFFSFFGVILLGTLLVSVVAILITLSYSYLSKKSPIVFQVGLFIYFALLTVIYFYGVNGGPEGLTSLSLGLFATTIFSLSIILFHTQTQIRSLCNDKRWWKSLESNKKKFNLKVETDYTEISKEIDERIEKEVKAYCGFKKFRSVYVTTAAYIFITTFLMHYLGSFELKYLEHALNGFFSLDGYDLFVGFVYFSLTLPFVLGVLQSDIWEFRVAHYLGGVFIVFALCLSLMFEEPRGLMYRQFLHLISINSIQIIVGEIYRYKNRKKVG